VRVLLKTMYNTAPGDPDGPGVCPPRNSLPMPRPSLSQFAGQVRYLGSPVSVIDESWNFPPDYIAAPLVCTPGDAAVRDWTPAARAADFPDADPSRIFFFGSEVVPCSVYEIDLCTDPADEQTCTGSPLTYITSLNGDCWVPFGTAGQPNFRDINAVVYKYAAIGFDPGDPPGGGPPEWHALLTGNVVGDFDVAPNVKKVGFRDVGAVVDSYKFIAYKEVGPCNPDTATDNCGNPCNTAP
jgi:hypothetical protein